MAKRKQLPRGMHMRGDVYYARIMGPEGRMIRKSLSKDFTTASIMLADLRKKAELFKMGVLTEATTPSIRMFGELKERYLQHVKARNLSTRSVEAFTVAYKRVVCENRFTFITDMKLEKVESWARQCSETGTRGQTVNHYVGLVLTALRWAHESGHIKCNPLANWKRLRHNDPRKRRDFQPEEITLFLQSESDPEFFLLWLVYFTTGLRATAGKNICWDWIDWRAEVLRLPMEWNKSHRVHEVPLGKVLLDQLAKLRDNVDGLDGRIFKPISPIRLLRRLRQNCERAGIDTDGICLHSIRHTVATMIYKQTGNIKAVQEILGHTNPATTMRYLHVTTEEKRKAINALDLGLNTVINDDSAAAGA